MDGQEISFINVPPKTVATEGDGRCFIKNANIERGDVTVLSCLSVCDALIRPYIIFRGGSFREM